ncbi:MAG: hypothetical protein EPN48_18235 [Microbacteriaceae bacterium]|nr:MAG: hypothetical protein EPN48_18235 [Microbacteriaceae bacterium]
MHIPTDLLPYMLDAENGAATQAGKIAVQFLANAVGALFRGEGLLIANPIGVKRLGAFLEQAQHRFDLLGGRVSALELATRLQDPSVQHLMTDAARMSQDTDREDVYVALAELIAQRLLVETDSSDARIIQRALAIVPSLAPEDLLLLGTTAFVNGLEIHEASPTAAAAMAAGDIVAYDDWLSSSLKRLTPTDPQWEQVHDLISQGLFTQRADSDLRGGTMINHQAAIDTVLSHFGTEAARGTVLRGRDRIVELTEPQDGMGRLEFGMVALARYWLTPIGMRLAVTVLANLTDMQFSR